MAWCKRSIKHVLQVHAWCLLLRKYLILFYMLAQSTMFTRECLYLQCSQWKASFCYVYTGRSLPAMFKREDLYWPTTQPQLTRWRPHDFNSSESIYVSTKSYVTLIASNTDTFLFSNLDNLKSMIIKYKILICFLLTTLLAKNYYFSR